MKRQKSENDVILTICDVFVVIRLPDFGLIAFKMYIFINSFFVS